MTLPTPPSDLAAQGSATERYAQCRTALVAEQEEPVKDFARIDALIEALATLQLDITHAQELPDAEFKD